MKELIAALVEARKTCKPTIHKEGRNLEQNYSFVGHEHVLLGGARDALLANGLILEEVKTEFIGPADAVSKNGTRMIWRWRGYFKLAHVSGDERSYEYEATTIPNDKAAFVASTALDRIAHLRLLELAGSNEENPEHESHERDWRERDQQQRAPAQRQTRAKPADGKRAQVHGAPASDSSPQQVFQPGTDGLYGVKMPAGDMPTFSENAAQHANKPWIEAVWIVEGWLKEPATVERMMRAGVLDWARALAEHRRRRKAWEASQKKAGAQDPHSSEALSREQEEAERALGGAKQS